jgi:hypothetical protein
MLPNPAFNVTRTVKAVSGARLARVAIRSRGEEQGW